MSELPGIVVFTPIGDIVGGGYTIAEAGRTASAAIITRTTIPSDTNFLIGDFLTVITISVLVFKFTIISILIPDHFLFRYHPCYPQTVRTDFSLLIAG